MESPASVLLDSTAVDVEAKTPKRKPKRVLHFSDGTLVEYSDDDELHDADDDDDGPADDPKECAAVAEKRSPQHMRWGEYLLHLTMAFGVQSLNVCDYLGERFAWVLGITTPKYGYAIEEREWQKKEEAEEKAREDRERSARVKRNAVGPAESAVYSVADGVNMSSDSDILSSEMQKY